VFATAGAGGIALTAWALDVLHGPAPFALTVVPAIFAFLAFGVDPGLAVAAVLGYRAFEYWLPVVPGVLAYVRLLRTVREWDDSEITQSM
jgi:uncharacterized membrane protein YbhN (UPF0104 family)